MGIAEFVNQIQQQFRQGMNFIQHPQEILWQQGRRRAEDWYNNVEMPGKNQQQKQESISPATPITYPQSTPVTCLEIGEKLESSRWDIYTIENCLQIGDKVSLYQGRTSNDELVLIKEYRLKELGFSQKDIKERREEFLQIIELNLKIGHGPDFRLVKLIDAIAKENNCYLITKYIKDSTTLKEYLAQHGVMTAKPIREVIKQVLETLQYLQAYRVRFAANNLERGLPHGNINLNSLIFKKAASSFVPDERQFFIYLSDLALWENLFFTPDSQFYQSSIAKNCQSLGSISQDLKNLGIVGFLLAGGKVDGNLQSTDFESAPIWSGLKDYELKKFIQRLLGFTFPFQTAEEALDTLIKLPENGTQSPITVLPVEPQINISPIETVQHTPKSSNRLLPLLLITSALITMGLLIYARAKNQEIPTYTSKLDNNNCCIKDKLNKKYTYVVESGGWEPTIKIPVFESDTKDFTKRSSMFDVLNFRSGNFTILPAQSNKNDLNSQAVKDVRQKQSIKSQKKGNQSTVADTPKQNVFQSRKNVFRLLNERKVDLALMRLPNDTEPEQKEFKKFKSETVAYDALVVIVAFRVNDRSQRTAAQKLDGEITLEDLRKVYLGEKVTINGYILKPLLPEEETAEIFKNLLFDNYTDKEKFEDFKKNHRKDQYKFSDLYAKILENPQINNTNNTITIGFDHLSKMVGNCSVYPLAIVNNNKPIQVLAKSNNRPIQPDYIDLCGDKGSYWSNVEVLKSGEYPLGYKLGVVANNESTVRDFAEVLRTTEGQYLLSQVGLVPPDPIPDIQQKLWQKKEPN